MGRIRRRRVDNSRMRRMNIMDRMRMGMIVGRRWRRGRRR